uniref:Uncharacterized protein n=1 Tax=Lotus japonicus TaxID=34305 RepID=I3SUD6_LOTJA|nr:unknown [Lotus japonicus]
MICSLFCSASCLIFLFKNLTLVLAASSSASTFA